MNPKNVVSLWIQLASEKVFNLLKTPQTTILEGIWIPRVWRFLGFLGFLGFWVCHLLGPEVDGSTFPFTKPFFLGTRYF